MSNYRIFCLISIWIPQCRGRKKKHVAYPLITSVSRGSERQLFDANKQTRQTRWAHYRRAKALSRDTQPLRTPPSFFVSSSSVSLFLSPSLSRSSHLSSHFSALPLPSFLALFPSPACFSSHIPLSSFLASIKQRVKGERSAGGRGEGRGGCGEQEKKKKKSKDEKSFFCPFLCSIISLSVVPHQTELGGDHLGNEKLKGKQMRERVLSVFLICIFYFLFCFLSCLFAKHVLSTWLKCIEQCNEGLFRFNQCSPCWRWAPVFSPSASEKEVLVGWGVRWWLVQTVRGSRIVLEGGLGERAALGTGIKADRWTGRWTNSPATPVTAAIILAGVN